MHLIYPVVLLIIYFAASVDCKGGRRGGGFRGKHIYYFCLQFLNHVVNDINIHNIVEFLKLILM
jgi:hypothetical protein